MKKEMDIRLYKYEIIKGKRKRRRMAEFLKRQRKAGGLVKR